MEVGMLNEMTWRTVRFMVSGAVSLIVYYIAYIGLTESGVHYLVASVGGFISYWVVNFFLHKYWTFKSAGESVQQAKKHFAMHLFNQGLIMVGLYVLIDIIGFHYVAAQLILTFVITVEVFLLSHLIFKSD